MTEYTEAALAAHHSRSSKNQDAIQSAKQVGCFDCLAIYPAVEVTDFIDNTPCGDAICPRCGTDSVLADDGSHALSKELLGAMHKRYFTSEGKSEKKYSSFSEMFETVKKRT